MPTNPTTQVRNEQRNEHAFLKNEIQLLTDTVKTKQKEQTNKKLEPSEKCK